MCRSGIPACPAPASIHPAPTALEFRRVLPGALRARAAAAGALARRGPGCGGGATGRSGGLPRPGRPAAPVAQETAALAASDTGAALRPLLPRALSLGPGGPRQDLADGPFPAAGAAQPPAAFPAPHAGRSPATVAPAAPAAAARPGGTGQGNGLPAAPAARCADLPFIA